VDDGILQAAVLILLKQQQLMNKAPQAHEAGWQSPQTTLYWQPHHGSISALALLHHSWTGLTLGPLSSPWAPSARSCALAAGPSLPSPHRSHPWTARPHWHSRSPALQQLSRLINTVGGGKHLSVCTVLTSDMFSADK